MQLCELQKAEDLGVLIGEDLSGPLSEEQAAAVAVATSGEETAGVEGGSSDEEAVEDDPAPPGVGEQADGCGDTTEESSDADVKGDLVVASPMPSAATHFHSSAYEDSELERDAPPPVSPTRGKSPVRDAAEQVDGGACEVVDLSSGSDPDSEGSSFMPVSKPPPSSRRTKELEAAAQDRKSTRLNSSHPV